MENKQTNVDCICVAKHDGRELRYDEIDIQHKHEDVIEHLTEMSENDDVSPFDMLEYFKVVFPDGKYIEYHYPYSYSDQNYPFWSNNVRYWFGGMFPVMEMDKEELEKKILKIQKEMYIPSSYSDFEKQEERAKKRREYVVSIKKSLLRRCKEYILAMEYAKLARELDNDPSVKLRSFERIGWSFKEFKLSDDVEITLSTNFIYGNSSYFNVGIIYKGVQLVFYSNYVKYYYAKVVDIIGCTRKYIPERNNWRAAIKFLVENTNLAQKSPEEFCKSFIKTEVDNMMAGLRDFMQREDSVRRAVDYCQNLSHAERISPYVGLRHVSGEDIKKYKLHPSEMETTFRAEKISGALDLLDSLRKFESLGVHVSEPIDEIVEMNKHLLPKLERLIQIVEEDIKNLDSKIEDSEIKISQLSESLKPFYEEIERLTEGLKYPETQKKRDEYDATHPEYRKLKEIKIAEEKKYFQLKSDRIYRNNFMSDLKRSREKIVRFFS